MCCAVCTVLHPSHRNAKEFGTASAPLSTHFSTALWFSLVPSPQFNFMLLFVGDSPRCKNIQEGGWGACSLAKVWPRKTRGLASCWPISCTRSVVTGTASSSQEILCNSQYPSGTITCEFSVLFNPLTHHKFLHTYSHHKISARARNKSFSSESPAGNITTELSVSLRTLCSDLMAHFQHYQSRQIVR